MANSVNQPALSLGPIEGPSGNSANNGNSAVKSTDKGSFSRLMSEQSEREPETERRSENRSSSTDAGGKNLPPGRLDVAEAGADTPSSKNDATSIEANVGKAPAGLSGLLPESVSSSTGSLIEGQGTDAGDPTIPDSIVVPVVNADASPAGIAPAGTKSGNTLLAAPRINTPSEASELSSDAGITDVAAVASIIESAQESELSISGSAVAPDVTSVREHPASRSAAVVSAATEGEAITGLATENGLGASRSAAVVSAATAGEAITGLATENGQGASRSAAVVSAATAIVDSVLEGKRPAADRTAASPVLPTAASGADGRIAVQEADSGVLTRSRADWLRSALGPDSQSAMVVSSQIDELVEPMRTATPQPRLDSASSSPLAPLVSGLPPTPSSSSGAISGANQAAQPDYSMRYAPGDAQFPGEITARMKTLIREGVREARLHLHPAELGRLYVTVVTEGDQARVTFLAETSAARDSIEQSMPRLREMLEQNGLELAQSDVGHHDFHSDRQDSQVSQSARLADEADGAPETELVEQLVSHSARSRIDTYI